MKRVKQPIIIGCQTALLFFILFCHSVPVFADEALVYHGAERRDPMVPLVGPGGIQMPQNFGLLNVEGIIYDPPSKSLVLINGEFYKEGDQVEDAKIITIFKDRVLIKREEEENTLWLHEEILNPEKIKHDSKRSPKSSAAKSKSSNVKKK